MLFFSYLRYIRLGFKRQNPTTFLFYPPLNPPRGDFFIPLLGGVRGICIKLRIVFHKKGGISLEKEHVCPYSPLIPPNPPLKKGGKKDKFRKEGRIFSWEKFT